MNGIRGVDTMKRRAAAWVGMARGTLAVLAMFAVALSGDAGAQYVEEDDAVISARSFRPIAAGVRVALRIADDTELNQRLAAVTADALRRAGYQVVEDNPEILLRLETRRPAEIGLHDRSVGSFEAGSGHGRPTGNVGGPRGVGVDLNLRLWSSTRNSLLKRTKRGAAPRQGFSVIFDAYDETAGKAAWHGDARARNVGGDSFRAGSAMIQRLIDVFGSALEPTPVSLW